MQPFAAHHCHWRTAHTVAFGLMGAILFENCAAQGRTSADACSVASDDAFWATLGGQLAPLVIGQVNRTAIRRELLAPTTEPSTQPSGGLFPANPRPLKPYLQMADRFGTKAIEAGALIKSDPLSDAAQFIKTEFAKIGVRYSYEQNFTMVSMTDRVQGGSLIGATGFSFFGNWTIFESDDLGGTCGWLTTKFVGGIGLNSNWETDNPKKDIGALSSPNNDYHSIQGAAFQQLAWAQSFASGEFVFMLGMINQTNYLDINRYANSAHGQLLNASFVNSLVLPAPSNNLGVQFQWQPSDGFYAMLGIGANNQDLGTNPFNDVSFNNMSYVGEFGFIVDDLHGLGPGTYRVQPFLATINGDTGGGIGFNMEQQLGAKIPLGMFARAGVSDSVIGDVSGNAQAQASIGLAMLSPFGERGFFSAPNHDFLGAGFVWSRAGDDPGLSHRNEYAFEFTGVIQLTPTTTLQPDIQLVWDPVKNPDSGPAVVFQLQLNITW